MAFTIHVKPPHSLGWGKLRTLRTTDPRVALAEFGIIVGRQRRDAKALKDEGVHGRVYRFQLRDTDARKIIRDVTVD